MKKLSEKYLTQSGKCNIRIISIPEGEEKDNGAEGLFKEIIAENFPNLGRELEIHAKEASSSPNFVNVKRPTPRHIVVKLAKAKDKENILRAARWKKNLQRNLYQSSVNFSAETLQARREWNDIFKILKDKNLKPRILYPVKISLRYDRKIKPFADKQKLRECIAIRPPPPKEILKKAVIPEKKNSKRATKP
uniref:L1 transposable element RRM domain-containing protein n=1 Tax=Equus caballus TaxID=9796 RepID=A0A9L0SS16_HORSE